VHSIRKGFISLVFNLPAERFITYTLLYSINHCYKNLVLFCFYGIESAALPTVANSLCNVLHCSGNTSISSIILQFRSFFLTEIKIACVLIILHTVLK